MFWPVKQKTLQGTCLQPEVDGGLQEVNIPQLVWDERGTVFVPRYDWQAFLIPFSKAVKGIKQHHHFSFSHQAQGMVMATTHAEGPTQILPVLVGDAGAVPHAPPPRVQSPGFLAYRQWYLFNSIHDFCTDDTKDIMCPKPTVPQPGPAPPTRQIAAPLPQGEADPEGGGDAPARGRGRGRGRGLCSGRGQGRGRGRGWGKGGGAQRKSDSESSSTLEEEEEEITIPVLVSITSPITSPITKDIASRSGAWLRSGSGLRSGLSKGTFVLQIDFATVIINNYYCPCYILTYVDFRTIMLSLQILIWTAKSSRQNVSDFLHDYITFY